MNNRFHEDRLETLSFSDGIDLTVHTWDASNPVGILIGIHGGMAHAGDFVTPALYFKEQGWTTTAFDQRGHALHRRVHIDRFNDFIIDVDTFVQQVKKQWPTLPVYVLGHSMGALIATHYGLQLTHRIHPSLTLGGKQTDVNGYILSSPFWANAIKVNPIVKRLSNVLSKCVPAMQAPIEDFTNVLTHDESITARHLSDASDALRGSKASIRFAAELLQAQEQLKQSIRQWNLPSHIILAGTDKLADTRQAQHFIETMAYSDIDVHLHPDNYHENLNELNREVIYQEILNWLNSRTTN